MKRLTTYLLLSSFALLLPATTFAFDGHRKGFTFGGGLGVAPVVHWSDDLLSPGETEVGIPGNLLIGFGPDERNLLMLSSIVASVNSPFGPNELTFHALRSFSWYHFLNDRPRSPYTTAGVGQLALWPTPGRYASGFGFHLEAGYQLQPHLLAGFYVIKGWPRGDNITTTYTQTGLLLRVLAY